MLWQYSTSRNGLLESFCKIFPNLIRKDTCGYTGQCSHIHRFFPLFRYLALILCQAARIKILFVHASACSKLQPYRISFPIGHITIDGRFLIPLAPSTARSTMEVSHRIIRDLFIPASNRFSSVSTFRYSMTGYVLQCLLHQ